MLGLPFQVTVQSPGHTERRHAQAATHVIGFPDTGAYTSGHERENRFPAGMTETGEVAGTSLAWSHKNPPTLPNRAGTSEKGSRPNQRRRHLLQGHRPGRRIGGTLLNATTTAAATAVLITLIVSGVVAYIVHATGTVAGVADLVRAFADLVTALWGKS